MDSLDHMLTDPLELGPSGEGNGAQIMEDCMLGSIRISLPEDLLEDVSMNKNTPMRPKCLFFLNGVSSLSYSSVIQSRCCRFLGSAGPDESWLSHLLQTSENLLGDALKQIAGLRGLPCWREQTTNIQSALVEVVWALSALLCSCILSLGGIAARNCVFQQLYQELLVVFCSQF